MNFEFDTDQMAIADLAESIFRDHGSDDRIRKLYETGKPFDEELWQQLSAAGLLSVIVPAEYGGSGLGMVEFGTILEKQGATLAPVPMWRHALAALALAKFGTDAVREKYLPAFLSGEQMLSLCTEVSPTSQVTASTTGNGWSITGHISPVTMDERTDHLIVPASLPDGRTAHFLVPLKNDKVEAAWGTATNYESVADLHFNGLELSGDMMLEDDGLGEWIVTHSCLAISAFQLGVLSEALKRAATYVGERQQFGRPIGTFQAVAMRMSDAYIQVELLRTAQWQLAWRIDNNVPVEAAAHVTKFQASQAGHTVGHTTQHYHGGIGADLTYPIHRFFLWATALDLASGGAEAQLEALAQVLPDHVGYEKCLPN